MTINPINFLFTLILLYFIVVGIKKGFIEEIRRIIGIIFGFNLANKYYDNLNNLITAGIPQYIKFDEVFRNIINYLLIFTFVFLLVSFFMKILNNFFSFPPGGWLNRLTGGLLGLVKGLLVIAFGIFILEVFPQTDTLKNKIENDSRLFRICNKLKEFTFNELVTNFSKSNINEYL